MTAPSGGNQLASVKEWGFLTEQNEQDVTVPNGVPTVILGNDPERIGALVINQDADAARLSKKRDVSATLGIPLDANGGAIAITPLSDGEGVGGEWWVFLGGAASGVFTVITLRRRGV